MNSAELLFARDRCERLAYYSQRWQWHRILPSEALRYAIETAISSESEDPGRYAGDLVMGLGADRGFETTSADLFSLGTHFAGLADLITATLVRRCGTLARPEDVEIGKGSTWESSAFLDAQGLKLRRIVLASRWSKEREMAEKRSVFSLFEACVYEVPVQMTIFVIGQNREGRHHGVWTKAYRHPLNKTLKFRFKPRKDSQYGANWEQVWREQTDVDREEWLEAMQDDGVLQEACFDVEVPVPPDSIRRQILDIAINRLKQIQQTTDPSPSPSQCFFPSRCQFVDACWQFTEPCERLGYVRLG